MRKLRNETIVLKKGKKDIELDYAELRKAVLVLRAVNHKLRQQIIELLEENEKMTVTDLYIKLRLEQSVASQHLAILRRAGVVATERNGKFIYYRVDTERINHISRLVEELTENVGRRADDRGDPEIARWPVQGARRLHHQGGERQLGLEHRCESEGRGR